jgi:predicted nucleic acid-binding protein
MTRLCLDTSAYSHFKAGDDEALAAVRSAAWIGVPVIVLGELRTGFRLGRRNDDNERELLQFLGEPIVHVLDVDDAASRHYADIVVSLRRRGSPLPTNDVWIASLAAREGATVLSYDTHFREVERVASRILGSAPEAG